MHYINYEMVRVYQDEIRRQTAQTQQHYERPVNTPFVQLDVGAVLSPIRKLLSVQQPQPCCEGVATT